MSLSEKRLAEIRERLTPLIFDTTDPCEDLLDVAGMADDLLEEVERLRQGLEVLCDKHAHGQPLGHHLYELLNPTEGETEE